MKNASILFIATILTLSLISCGDTYEMDELEQTVQTNEQAEATIHMDGKAQAYFQSVKGHEEASATDEFNSSSTRPDQQVSVNGEHDKVIGCFDPIRTYEDAPAEIRPVIDPAQLGFKIRKCGPAKQSLTVIDPSNEDNPSKYAARVYQIDWLTEDGKRVHSGVQLDCYCGDQTLQVIVRHLGNGMEGRLEFTPKACPPEE